MTKENPKAPVIIQLELTQDEANTCNPCSMLGHYCGPDCRVKNKLAEAVVAGKVRNITTKARKLRDKHEALKTADRDFLLAQGWRQSSDFPDFAWRWGKEIQGKMMWLSEKDAIQIEFRLNL